MRKAKYDLSQDEIKPYFELNNLVKGMFWSAEQLYDLKFTENTGKVPVFHPDVRTFEVTNAKTGEVIGLFYLDTYARQGKRSGAWATTYRSRAGLLGDKIVLGSNNNNFTKPSPGQPVLISLNDAETLWHEFGHAIHYYLSDVKYPSLGGSPRDFVEYPSQVNENWLMTRPVLDKFARHYQTGAAMPEALVKKIEASETFNQGFATVEYLSSALVDMMLHTHARRRGRSGQVRARGAGQARHAEGNGDAAPPAAVRSPVLVRQLFGRLLQLPVVGNDGRRHLGGVRGDWQSLRPQDRRRVPTYLLSTGNETDRAEAYRQFRGRDPDVEALLKRRGFPTN